MTNMGLHLEIHWWPSASYSKEKTRPQRGKPVQGSSLQQKGILA